MEETPIKTAIRVYECDKDFPRWFPGAPRAESRGNHQQSLCHLMKQAYFQIYR